MKTDAVIFIHRLYFNGQVKKGGPDLIIDRILSEGKTVLMFEYPLDLNQENKIVISRVTEGGCEVIRQFREISGSDVINWIFETLVSLILGVYYKNGAPLVLSADPLTTLPAVILRKLGLFRFHYYHSVDYSTDRFSNKFLNYFYTKLLVFGLRNADLVGVVTRQARERLAQFNVKNIIFIPNSPDYHSLDYVRKETGKRRKNVLVVTCSEVLHKYLIHELIGLLPELKKEFPDINLRIIGYFDRNSEYGKSLIKQIEDNALSENVTFYGNVGREENYRIISDSYIGLAFYDGNYSHVIYGDSLKIREYCALGLPVVADRETYTAVEMAENNCGYAVDNVSEAVEYIKKLLMDRDIYENRSFNSLKWSQEYDKREILKTVFSEMGLL